MFQGIKLLIWSDYVIAKTLWNFKNGKRKRVTEDFVVWRRVHTKEILSNSKTALFRWSNIHVTTANIFSPLYQRVWYSFKG